MCRWFLVLICVCAAMLAAKSGRKGTAPAAAAVAAEKTTWPAEVEGLGLTIEAAKKDAVKNIVEHMTKFLNQQEPPITEWRPTSDFVKRHIIDGNGVQGEDENIDGLGRAKRWDYRVKNMDVALVRSLDEQARRGHLSEQRARLALRFFAACALILVGFTVYVRLDERRRRR